MLYLNGVQMPFLRAITTIGATLEGVDVPHSYKKCGEGERPSEFFLFYAADEI